MLEFFRRYQRYFYLVITIVTIISFSFFGTYSTLDSSNTWREQVAFKTINGREVTRYDLDEMAVFLATDSEDKVLFGGAWGPNFLNDGVIRKDFLETGLAQELMNDYQTDLEQELQTKLEKEKKFKLYSHPQARFLSVQNAWEYFTPDMSTYYTTLRSAQNSASPEAFQARINLFLAEKAFPASTLRQVLRYQERQYNWLDHDPALDQTDLSLFGYHTLEDWFGPRFTRLVSQFIMNAAILAEQNGYEVSRAEALADLIRNTEVSYQQNKSRPAIGVASPEEYLNEQLRRMNMDQAKAIKIWRQIMLFRRYFHDAGSSALVDTLTYQKFNDYAQESLKLDIYRLPSALRFGDYTTLQKFETYVQAVGKGLKKEDPLALPAQFLTVAEVAKQYPELVQKKYLLEIAQVNKKDLQSRVGVKETWAWEVEDQNWEQLKKQFPDLGIKPGATREERFAALDSLDSITRSKVDAFARSAIVNAHPEWLEQAFEKIEPKKMIVGIRPKGGKLPLEGLDQEDKRLAFVRLLDQAPLKEDPKPESNLYAYSANQQNYYRIKVVERSPQQVILTFAEANVDGTLDNLRDRLLEKHYAKVKTQNPLLYQKEDQSWKEFNSVKDLVAEEYFTSTLDALRQLYKTTSPVTEKVGKDQLASLRFYLYVQQAKANIEQHPEQEGTLAFFKEKSHQTDQWQEQEPLIQQWWLEKEVAQVNRQDGTRLVNSKEAFTLPEQAWSEISTPANGDLVFYQVKEKGRNPKADVAIAEQVRKAQTILSANAQRVLMQKILKELSAKQAISFAYLNQANEEEEPSQSNSAELE